MEGFFLKFKTLLNLEIAGLPPTVNHIYRTARGSFRYKTAETRAWQEQTTSLMSKKRKEDTFLGGVALFIVIKTDNRRRWDLDNRIKALQDCLAPAKIIKDDSQILALYIKREIADKTSTKIILKGVDK